VQLGMIGLGRMGANMAQRLQRGGHAVVGFDPLPEARARADGDGIATAASLDELAGVLQRVCQTHQELERVVDPPNEHRGNRDSCVMCAPAMMVSAK
jgi:3-hydroxyisobutyrate dehydrogenase-like beta-hydroxyacid dehydrogenase